MKWISALLQLALYVALLLLSPVFAAPRSTRTGRKEPRYGLIIAPVGDGGSHTEWLKGARFKGRNWDLAALYYGNDPKFSCKECRMVWHGQGAKWNLVQRFLKEEKRVRRLAHRYAAVMIADDDLKMTAKDINAFFDLVIAFNLTIAQPSLCPDSYSYWISAVGQHQNSILHYTNFVELMAPTFSGSFFDSVIRSTLQPDVHSGWGLDYVWPYLAGWQRDNVAVIDAMCMHHANDPWRSNRMYNADLPLTPEAEWDMILSRYNMTEEVVTAAGFLWKQPSVFEEVPAGTMIPKVNWKKKLDKTLPVSGNVESHSGLAVFIVMLVACGGLLVTGAAQTRRSRRMPRRKSFN